MVCRRSPWLCLLFDGRGGLNGNQEKSWGVTFPPPPPRVRGQAPNPSQRDDHLCKSKPTTTRWIQHMAVICWFWEQAIYIESLLPTKKILAISRRKCSQLPCERDSWTLLGRRFFVETQQDLGFESASPERGPGQEGAEANGAEGHQDQQVLRVLLVLDPPRTKGFSPSNKSGLVVFETIS